MAKVTYTLNLYRGDESDIPLSQITIKKSDELSAKVAYGYIKVEPNSDLFSLPNGTNPRALNSESAKVKKIKNTLINSPGFAVYNGGICVVVDNDSIRLNDDNTSVSFTCEEVDSGHYDGQHTREALRQGCEEVDDQQASVMLVESRFFDDVKGGSRAAAETWNSRETQKPHSEQNQRGSFDLIKQYIDSQYLRNIAFRENDRNSNNEIIMKECRIDRLVALLYTGIDVLRSENLDAGETMYSILRSGYSATKLVENNEQHQDFKRLYPVVNTVIELSDFIQSSLRDCYGDDTAFDSLEIIRKSSKRDLKKDVLDRKHVKQNLFDGTQATECLLPEYIQPIMFGFLKNVLALDSKSNNAMIKNGWDIEDLKAMWSYSCRVVMDKLDSLFKKKFKNNFNSRHAEFGCYSFLWTECDKIIAETIVQGKWRKLQEVA